MADSKKLEINPIIYPSVELKMLLDKAIQENKVINTEVLPFPTLPTEIGQSDLALAVILDLKPSDKKVAIKEAWDKMEATIKLTIKGQIEALENNVSAIFFNTIFKIVYELIDQIIGPFDQDIINVQVTWNKVIRIYRELCDPDLDEKIKESLKKKLIEILNTIINEVPLVADVIALIMLFDTMRKTIKCLRDAKKASVEEYGEVNGQIILTEEILNQEAFLKSQIITTIVYFLGIILPLISVLGSIFNTGRKFNQEYSEAMQAALEEENKKFHDPKEGYESEIKRFAENNQYGFSYSKEKSQSSKNTQQIPTGAIYKKKGSISGKTIWKSVGLEDITTNTEETGEVECVVSYGTIYGEISEDDGKKILKTINKNPDFCHSDIDYKDLCTKDFKYPNTDTDGIPFSNSNGDGQPIEHDAKDLEKNYGPIGALLEYATGTELSLFYSNGESVTGGTTIGTMNGQKINSPCDGLDTKTDNNVSFVKYKKKDASELLEKMQSLGAMSELRMSQQNALQPIVDKFEKLAKTKQVIKDCILRTKLPHIPNTMTNTSKPASSKQAIVEMYTNHCDSFNEAFEKSIEFTTGKEHVEDLLNAGRMEDLKNEILSLNNAFFTGVFDIYDNYLNSLNRMCEQESVESFSLLDEYMELYDNINYDENNEYIVEFSKMIAEFIKDRKYLECMSNSEKMAHLNSLCDEYLLPKWKFDKSYFDKFEELYATKQNAPVTSTNEEDSAYKTLLNFLVTLMDCAEEEQQTISFTSIDDISNFGSNTGYNMEKAEMRNKMKKICRRFFLVREMGNTQANSTDETKIRLNRLKTQCAKEVGLIDTFVNKVRNDYYNSISVLDDGTFDDFKEADVRKMQNVFYNGDEYEHYFIVPGDSSEAIDLDDYGNMLSDFESSAATKRPPYDIWYWLVYCMQATLVHCMLPMYWSTGLLILGAPLLLPVIYIPIYCLKGDVTILFGLGICGMYIYPMILFVNFNLDPRTILAPLNMLVSMMRNTANEIEGLAKNSIKGIAHKKMESAKNSRDGYEKELEDIDIQITNAKELLVGLGKARKERSKKRKEDRKNKKEQAE